MRAKKALIGRRALQFFCQVFFDHFVIIFSSRFTNLFFDNSRHFGSECLNLSYGFIKQNNSVIILS